MSNYELKIFGEGSKEYKKYDVDGTSTIGVFENEPFSIEFTNKTWSRIQCKISLDGTSVITGELEDTSVDGRMWVVEPYGKLVLKSWQENSNGGAGFIFSKTSDSVAANTHKYTKSIGLIGAAVFIERYVQPTITYTNIDIPISNPWKPNLNNPKIIMYGPNFSSNSTLRSCNFTSSNSSSNFLGLAESNLGVGAGDYVEQKIQKVAGLKEPGLSEVIQIKYMDWNILRSYLRGLEKQEAQYKAFPADGEKFVDLKLTPRILKKKKYISFERFV